MTANDLGCCKHNGAMVSQKCQVVFTILIQGWACFCPFVLVVSHGVHTHPPPVPNKTPFDLVEDIRKLAHEIQSYDLLSGPGIALPCTVPYSC